MRTRERTEQLTALGVLAVFTALAVALVNGQEDAQAERDDYRRSLEQATSQPLPTITQTVTQTVTQKVTLPPKIVVKTVRVQERATRSLPARSQLVSTPERMAGQRATGAIPLTGWKARYWSAAQVWANTPKVRAVRMCESTDRVGAISSTGKFRGLYQIDPGKWAGYGGLELAPKPNLASRAAQNYVAYRIYVGNGWRPWECA